MAVTPTTAWWIGIGTCVAALVGAGATAVYVARKKAKELAPKEPLEGVGEPGVDPDLPPPPPPPPDPPEFGLDVDLAGEICRQWKVGQDRPNWRPALYEIIHQAVDREIEAQGPFQWDTLPEARGQAFYVTRAALASLCQDMPLPQNIGDVQRLSTAAGGGGFYWSELWGELWNRAWPKISGLGT